MFKIFKSITQLKQDLYEVAEFGNSSRQMINRLYSERDLILNHFGHSIVTNKKGTTFLRKKREPKPKTEVPRVKRKYTKRQK